MNRRYPPEMQDFVRHMASDRVSNSEMARRCVERFGLDKPISPAGMQSYKSDHGIVNPPRYSRKFIKAVLELVPSHSLQEIADILSVRFGRPVTYGMLRGIMKRRGILTGRTGQFEPGVSHGKGRTLSDETREKIRGTWFKKGGVAHNKVPVGTEVFRAGYMLVKVKDGPDLDQWDRWVAKHRLVWEQAHGPIPEGMMVIFLDGNTRNCELSNLALVSKEENGILNAKKLRSQNAQATKMAITVAKLNLAIKRKGKKNGNSD